MKKLKSQSGVITLITLITVLFLVSFLLTSYMLMANKVKMQKEILTETKKIYEPQVTMEEIYNSFFIDNNIIPIYTVEQLLAIGNDEVMVIDGKIYIFSNTQNTTYLLKNNLEFNGEWIPPYEDTDFKGNFDWSGNTISVTDSSGETVEYNGRYLATLNGYPLTLKNCTGEDLIDYRIYGNSIQNGTPNPKELVEVQNLGDLVTDENDENYGKYKIPITVTGKNLLNPDTVDESNVYVRSDNGKNYPPSSSGGTWKASDFIPVSEGKTYHFNAVNNNASVAGIAWYDVHKNYISGVNTITINKNNGNISAPENAKYLRVSWRIDEGYNSNWENTLQLEEGTSSTPYEPYVGQTYSIYLDEPLRKLGNYAEYIDFTNGQVIRYINKIDLDGDEKWTTWGVNNSKEGITGFYSYLLRDLQVPIAGSDRTALSNFLPYNHSSWGGAQVGCRSNGNYFLFSVDNSYLSDISSNDSAIASFKSLLSANNAEFYYILEEFPEPEVIDLPNIPTDRGTITLTVETTVPPSNVSVTYNAKQ